VDIKKSKKIIIALFVGAVLSISALVVVVVSVTANASTNVPDFNGMTLMEAAKISQEHDLVIKDGQMVEGEAEDKGKIVEQYPLAGQKVKAGDVIIVKVCFGLGDGRTPDVLSMTTADAKKTIEDAGFEVGIIEQVAGVEKAGTVVAQNPVGDKELEKGTKINITVSDGTMVYVPNVLGKDVGDAEYILQKAGLQGKWTAIEFSEKIDYGCVIKQTPRGGSVVKRGTIVKYVESAGSESEYQ
jgi:beta-lactam-binding protein with PASTA domain